MSLDEHALACAVDALYHHQHPEDPIDRIQWGYPAPISGPVAIAAKVVLDAYMAVRGRRIGEVE